eukprot:1153782-Pelagomonas_calceolata.AAC.5
MAMFGACRLVHRFTRMAGEIFGKKIAMLGERKIRKSTLQSVNKKGCFCGLGVIPVLLGAALQLVSAIYKCNKKALYAHRCLIFATSCSGCQKNCLQSCLNRSKATLCSINETTKNYPEPRYRHSASLMQSYILHIQLLPFPQGLISEFRPEPSYRRNASLVQNAGVDPSKPLINPTAPDPGAVKFIDHPTDFLLKCPIT